MKSIIYFDLLTQVELHLKELAILRLQEQRKIYA